MDRRAVFVVLLCCFLCIPAYAVEFKPKKAYRFSWKERNGYIDTTTICDRYRKGSLDYRKCRSYALDYFKAKCKKYTDLVDSSGGPHRDKYRAEKRKHCTTYRALP